MKCNRWTIGLLAAGLVSVPALVQAEETASSVLTALSSTTLSGYVDTSAQWNFGTGNTFVPNYTFGGPSKADGFNLNVVKLTIEKPVEAADVWAAGYKVDLLAGPDANALMTQSGLSQGDFGVKQAYVALRAPVGNGLNFKMGVWDTIIGYEVFESVNNPNFTRSYGYTMEPTTHTGVQVNYQFNDVISATAAIANSFGPKINERSNPPKAESYKTYMGALTLTAPDSMGFLAGSTLTGGVINGFNSGAVADQTSWYVGTTVNTPVKGLKVGASYDYAGVSEQTLTSESSYANALGGYLSYQLTEKLTVYARGEYATSDTAVFSPIGGTAIANKVVEATATLQYDLWKNVLSRLEFRWDHAADGSEIYGDSQSLKNSYMLIANIAYKF